MNRWWMHRTERGAVAIVVAISMVALMGAAAIGVDIGRLVVERQQLQNSLDAAAAAGAQQLPNFPAAAIAEAQWFASTNMEAAGLGSIVPQVALRCVVAWNTVSGSPDWTTASTVCGISSRVWDPLTCNEEICSIPCTVLNRCNTIVVKYDKRVDFVFGPAIDVPTGNTGTIVSAACRGFCGKAITNPMDVVVMADRTPSMASGDVVKMKTGIKAMLATMTREQQYIAFGAIHKSVSSGTCVSGAARGYNSSAFSTNNTSGKIFTGSWVPQKFSESYTTGSRDLDSLQVNTGDDLYKAVDCLQEYNDLKTYTTESYYLNNWPDRYTNVESKAYPKGETANGYGTHLASALKGAARYLVGSNNLTSLGDRTQYGKVQKVILFETDGRPEEVFLSGDGALDLTSDFDIGSPNGETACSNLKKVAENIKKLPDPPLIIAIGYGNAARFTCKKNSGAAAPLYNSGSMYVRDVLASIATNKVLGTPSLADKDCTSDAGIKAENADGDYFFCASDGADLADVFVTAMGSIKGHGRLMPLPGVETFTF